MNTYVRETRTEQVILRIAALLGEARRNPDLSRTITVHEHWARIIEDLAAEQLRGVPREYEPSPQWRTGPIIEPAGAS